MVDASVCGFVDDSIWEVVSTGATVNRDSSDEFNTLLQRTSGLGV